MNLLSCPLSGVLSHGVPHVYEAGRKKHTNKYAFCSFVCTKLSGFGLEHSWANIDFYWLKYCLLIVRNIVCDKDNIRSFEQSAIYDFRQTKCK